MVWTKAVSGNNAEEPCENGRLVWKPEEPGKSYMLVIDGKLNGKENLNPIRNKYRYVISTYVEKRKTESRTKGRTASQSNFLPNRSPWEQLARDPVFST